MKKPKPINADVVDLETEKLGASIAGQIARACFVRGVDVAGLAKLAGVEPDVVLAFMLDPANANAGMIARFSYALGLRWSLRMEPKEQAHV